MDTEKRIQRFSKIIITDLGAKSVHENNCFCEHNHIWKYSFAGEAKSMLSGVIKKDMFEQIVIKVNNYILIKQLAIPYFISNKYHAVDSIAE